MTKLAEKVDILNITINMEEIGVVFKDVSPWNAMGPNSVMGEFFQKIQRNSIVYKLNQSIEKDGKFPGCICKAHTTLKNKTNI